MKEKKEGTRRRRRRRKRGGGEKEGSGRRMYLQILVFGDSDKIRG